MRKMNLMKRAKTGAVAIVAICSLLSGGIVNAAENDGETTETSIEVTNEAGEDQAAVDDESIWDDSSEIIYHENGYYSDNIMAPRKGNTGSVSVNNAASYPATYKVKKLSGVRNQANSSICWAYAANTALETSYLNQNLGSSINYSEYQLTYSVFHGQKDRFISRGKFYDQSGSPLMSTATFAMNRGLGTEEKYPLNPSKTLTDADMTKGVSRVKNVLLLYGFSDEYSEYGGTSWQESINSIKKKVYQDRAVVVSIDASEKRYNLSTNSFFTSWNGGEKPSANHELTIIGWDDNKVTACNKKGAFLAQNSWGNDANKGTIWISYYDASICAPTVFTVDTSKSLKKDSRVYSYTETGCSGKTLASKVELSGANVFKAQHTVELNKVGFYTLQKGEYTIEVNVDLKNAKNPGSGRRVYTTKGKTTEAGYFRAPLAQKITVPKGETFSVKIYLKDSAGVYRVNFEGGDTAIVETNIGSGESFVNYRDGWYDCYGTMGKFDLGTNYRNICIYAYGDTTIPEVVHHRAKTATTTTPGNIEYFVKEGKYYTDVNCTKQVSSSSVIRYAFAKNASGVQKYGDKMYYLKNGAIDKSYTGVSKNGGVYYYFKNGIANTTGLYKITVGKVTGWWYVKAGKVMTGYNGFVKNDSGWWYVSAGKVDFSRNEVLKGTVNGVAGWWNVKGGKVEFTNTISKNSSGWWCIQNGKVNFNFTGLAKNENGYFYCSGGKVDFGFTGIAKNENGYWYCTSGKVRFDYSGKVTYKGQTYIIKGGKVQ